MRNIKKMKKKMKKKEKFRLVQKIGAITRKKKNEKYDICCSYYNVWFGI